MKNKVLQAHIAILLANIIYGANYSIAKEVMPLYIKPFAFVLLRIGGALIMFLMVSTFIIKEKVDKKDLPRIALLGVCGVAINQLMFLKGLSLTTPINASIIMISNPIAVLLFAAIALKERMSINKIAGIALGIAGALLLLLFNKTFSFGSETITGDMMVLINSLSWACYVVLAKPLMKKYNTFTVVKWVFIFGFIYVFPFGYSEIKEVEWQTIPPMGWACISFVVIATTFLAYIFNTFALKALSPSVVSIYIYLQPFIATLIAVIFGKDELDARKIISALMIISGVYLVSLQKKQEPQVNKHTK
ncbi:MAG TPA: DMT family transporter [Bacteroidia bacterium]|jgi:drug/metabolite transporter (DMT)-like permease|nr:DMT family transporter [Bacteroidia bacterium]